MLKPEENYDPWVDELYLARDDARKRKIDELVTTFSEASNEAEEIAKTLTDKKQFEKPILLGYVHFTSNSTQRPDTISRLKFPFPVVALKHKELPIIMGITKRVPGSDTISIDDAKSSLVVTQDLGYTKTLSKMNSKEKQELFNLIVEGIRSYRKTENPGKDIVWLSDYLQSNKDFKFLGFAANLPYLNVDPKFGETRNFWVHAWGTPQLLFSHKRLPVIMIAGPSVRLDENVLGDKNMVGFTG